VEVVLSIPEAGEEYPLTLDSIAESKLPFLDVPFLPDRPEHTKLTLPLGRHTFTTYTQITHRQSKPTERALFTIQLSSCRCVKARTITNGL
jgi:hypothetical protein